MIVVRVYGILLNEKKEVLLSDEQHLGRSFTKFPGGGLEFGEGLKDCLIREFEEELNVAIQVHELIYLTDFFQPSAFHAHDQIISVYYRVSLKEGNIIPLPDANFQNEIFRWKKIKELETKDVTFPIDKLVVDKIKLMFL